MRQQAIPRENHAAPNMTPPGLQEAHYPGPANWPKMEGQEPARSLYGGRGQDGNPHNHGPLLAIVDLAEHEA